MPSWAATARAVRSWSPVTSTGRHAEPPDLAHRIGAARLDAVADREHRPCRAAPGKQDRRPPGIFHTRGRVPQLGGHGQAQLAHVPRAAQRGLVPGRGTGDARRRAGWRTRSRRAGCRTAPSRPGRWPGRSDAPRRPPPPPRPAGTPARPYLGPGMSSSRLIVPLVSVPVLSSTTTSIRRADSSACVPRTRIPSSAPRPTPASSAVLVASPSAQGHATTRTANAALQASWDGRPAPIQKPSVTTAMLITQGTNTAASRSASRCTAVLLVCA